MIWTPSREIIVPVRVVRPVASIAGRYKLEARKPDGRMRPLTGWFSNLITNTGLDAWLNSPTTGFFQTCAVGTGNTAPANTDTALATLLASTTTVQSSSAAAASSAPYEGTTTYTYSFAAGSATGNLSEVGIGTAATALFSRALILDGTGTPTTITVLSNEALYVTYQLKQIVPTADVVGNVTIGGVSYAYTLRAADATNVANWAPLSPEAGARSNLWGVSNGAIGAVTGSISGTILQPSNLSVAGYSNGSYALQATATWGLTSGNAAGGITAAQFNFGYNSFSRGVYQVGFAPAIPKDGSHVLTLTFGTSWARG